MPTFVNYRKYLQALVGLTAAVGPAYAIVSEVGHVETMVSVRGDYDSNIFLNSNNVSDFVTTASAQAKFVRDVALVASEISVGASGAIYGDHTEQKSLDPLVRGNLTYTPSDKTTISGGLSYQRNTIANEALNTRTKSNDFNFQGTVQHLFSEKLGYRVTADYRNNDYISQGYADVLSYSAGANAVYVYSPKLTMIGGYTYRESWNDNRPPGSANASSKDSRIAVGFEGELAPKLSGSLNVGVVNRSFKSSKFEDASALYLGARLKWVPAQKTSVAIDASEDFDLTAANQSSKVASFTVGITQIIDQKWSVDGSVALSHSNYYGASGAGSRTDDNFRIRGRASYAVTTNVSVDVSVGYGNVESTNAFSTYDRVNAGVGLAASF